MLPKLLNMTEEKWELLMPLHDELTLVDYKSIVQFQLWYAEAQNGDVRTDEAILCRDLTDGALDKYTQELSRAQLELETSMIDPHPDSVHDDEAPMPKLELVEDNDVGLVVELSKVKKDENPDDQFENNHFYPFMGAREALLDEDTHAGGEFDAPFLKEEKDSYKAALLKKSPTPPVIKPSSSPTPPNTAQLERIVSKEILVTVDKSKASPSINKKAKVDFEDDDSVDKSKDSPSIPKKAKVDLEDDDSDPSSDSSSESDSDTSGSDSSDSSDSESSISSSSSDDSSKSSKKKKKRKKKSKTQLRKERRKLCKCLKQRSLGGPTAKRSYKRFDGCSFPKSPVGPKDLEAFMLRFYHGLKATGCGDYIDPDKIQKTQDTIQVFFDKEMETIRQGCLLDSHVVTTCANGTS